MRMRTPEKPGTELKKENFTKWKDRMESAHKKLVGLQYSVLTTFGFWPPYKKLDDDKDTLLMLGMTVGGMISVPVINAPLKLADLPIRLAVRIMEKRLEKVGLDAEAI